MSIPEYLEKRVKFIIKIPETLNTDRYKLHINITNTEIIMSVDMKYTNLVETDLYNLYLISGSKYDIYALTLCGHNSYKTEVGIISEPKLITQYNDFDIYLFTLIEQP